MRRTLLAVFDLLLVVVIAITLFRLGVAQASQQGAPMDLGPVAFLKAYQGKAWWTLSAMGIWLVVRALKDDAFILPARFKVAAPYRPALALGLGLVAGVLEKVGTGFDWRTSMLWGLSAAVTAIFSHTAIVDGARGGRDIGVKPETFKAAPPDSLVPAAPPAVKP